MKGLSMPVEAASTGRGDGGHLSSHGTRHGHPTLKVATFTFFLNGPK